MSRKKSIINDTLTYASSNALAQVFGIVNSIALRRFLNPAFMGIWSILQVILSYCGYASFGTTKAMARDYPFHKGKGEFEVAEQIKNMTLTFTMIMSILPAAGIAGYLFFKGNQLEHAFKIGLCYLVPFLFLQRYYDLILGLLRADKRFNTVSIVTILSSVGGLLLTFTFVLHWQFYGLLVGTPLLLMSILWIIFKRNPYRFVFFWNVPLLLQELKLGIPLVGTGFLFVFLKGLDRIIIARTMGFEEVGLYSLAMMISGYIYSIPGVFSHVWYPNMQEAYGANSNPEAIRHFLEVPLLTLSVMIPALCTLGIYIMPVLVEVLLPKYIGGIDAMKIYLIGTPFVMIANISSNFLVTLDRFLINIPILMAASLVSFLSMTGLIHAGWGLDGAAWGMVAGFFVYGLLTTLAALSHFDKGRSMWAVLGQAVLIIILLFSGIMTLDRMIQHTNLLIMSLAKLAAGTLWCAPFFLYLNRKTGLVRQIWQQVLHLFGSLKR